jgi:predicted Zn-dependent protease
MKQPFKLFVASLSLSMIAGCQLIESKNDTPAVVDENPLSMSRQLAAKGRYSEAISLLDRASANTNLSTTYEKELERYRIQQKILEEELNDRLLISNTSALKNQLPILSKLTQASPDKPNYNRLLEDTQETLQSMQKALSECAWRHFKRNNALSKDCLTLALSLKQDKADQDLMEHILNEQIQYNKAVAKKKQANKKQKSKQLIDKKLAEAQKLIENGQLKDAKRALMLVLKESPKNETAKKLLADINQTLKKYIENLLMAGDRLYRDGEIESAKATWRAALNLDPMDLRARQKIKRAQRVLDNLENLRKTNGDDTKEQ